MKTDKRTRKQKTGVIGESLAEKFLTNKGYRIIEKNYRKPWGEIDIVAERLGTVRFVEVKTVTLRTYLYLHDAEEMVDRRKLNKVARTAALYMEHRKDGREYQIDVVAVVLDKDNATANCRLFEQALEGNL